MRKLLLPVTVWCAFLASRASGGDTWYTTGSPRDFTNATIWSAGVPGAADTAWFTNTANITITNSVGVAVTNANFYADPVVNATVALNFSAGGSYWVTNVFGIGHSGFSTSTVNWAGGILVVTNAARNATLYVGEGRKGTLGLNGGTVIADRLIATNGLNGADATLNFNGANLQTREADIRQSATVTWGGGSWTVAGGTNRYLNGGVNLRFRGAGEGSARLFVTGSGTVWTNDAILLIGDTAATSSRFVVSNGAKAYSANAGTIGSLNNTALTQSLALVSGGGSFWNSVGNFYISAAAGGDNSLVVNDGGSARFSGGSGGAFVGSGLGSTGRVFITGAGSIASFNNNLYVGSNSASASSKGFGVILVENNGTLELPGQLYTGDGGSGLVTNRGGVYQWALGSGGFAINTNSPNSMVLSGGVISFRGVTNAAVNQAQLSKITYLGENAFRLNNASNWNTAGNPANQDYTFDNTLGATNFARLEMINDGTAWLSARLSIGSGGSLLVSNSSASIRATAITNLGAVTVVNSSVRWQGNTVLGGTYVSDPSTNTFESNLTVTATGSLSGSNGDQFVFYRDFINQSTAHTNFSLWQAAVLFTNGAGTSNHTYNVAGSGSANWGTGFTNFDRVSTNFAIGTLSIAPNNRLMITGQVSGGITNAVYVRWLDIQGLTPSMTNSYDAVTNTLFAALNLPDINLYYDRNDLGNAWFNNYLPTTGYNLWSGGLLLPIPEPSAFVAILAGMGLLGFLRRRE